MCQEKLTYFWPLSTLKILEDNSMRQVQSRVCQDFIGTSCHLPCLSWYFIFLLVSDIDFLLRVSWRNCPLLSYRELVVHLLADQGFTTLFRSCTTYTSTRWGHLAHHFGPNSLNLFVVPISSKFAWRTSGGTHTIGWEPPAPDAPTLSFLSCSHILRTVQHPSSSFISRVFDFFSPLEGRRKEHVDIFVLLLLLFLQGQGLSSFLPSDMQWMKEEEESTPAG